MRQPVGAQCKCDHEWLQSAPISDTSGLSLSLTPSSQCGAVTARSGPDCECQPLRPEPVAVNRLSSLGESLCTLLLIPAEVVVVIKGFGCWKRRRVHAEDGEHPEPQPATSAAADDHRLGKGRSIR